MDPTKPTYDALVAVFMGVPPNRGKRSLLADLKTASGKEILTRLVQWADVVLVNQVRARMSCLTSAARVLPSEIRILKT